MRGLKTELPIQKIGGQIEPHSPELRKYESTILAQWNSGEFRYTNKKADSG